MSIKINTLQIENIKRVKAVALSPAESGLTVIGGKTARGKHQSWTQSPGHLAGIATAQAMPSAKAAPCRRTSSWSFPTV